MQSRSDAGEGSSQAFVLGTSTSATKLHLVDLVVATGNPVIGTALHVALEANAASEQRHVCPSLAEVVEHLEPLRPIGVRCGP